MGERENISRREALKLGFACGAGLLAGGFDAFAADASPKTPVWVIHGSDKAALMRKAMETMQAEGGFGRSVKKLALKVNAAWARTPAEGANTDPELVAGFLKGCREFGVSEVSVPEFPCVPAREAFVMSGINAAVEGAGFKMQAIGERSKNFAPVSLKSARRLTKAEVVDDFLKADAVVNMPVCKNHRATGISCAMKNWMGAVRDRRWWHSHDLQQCVADFAGFLKPTWTIIDATRVMMTRGPQGPSDNMKTPNALILSKDQVAADAFAAIEFFGSIQEADYIVLAGEMGLGPTSLAKMDVRRLRA